MKNLILLTIVLIAIFFGLTLTARLYNHKKNESQKSPIYITSTGNLIISGRTSNKEKLELFKKNIEMDDQLNSYWNHLHAASMHQQKGENELAILELKKALEIRKNGFEAHWGLADLYTLTVQYDLALKEYDWLQEYSTRPDVQKELAESRKRVEELKAKAENK